MQNWYTYLREGLSLKRPEDQIAGKRGYSGTKANLQNLKPYLRRHWRKGLLGIFLITFTSLLAFPQPLITRYIVDDVILNRHLGLLAGAILLFIAIAVMEKLIRLLEEFYFARFEQRVTLDIQQDLIRRVLFIPKSFFDDTQTGYLMSRLISDVDGVRWFFSGTIVYIVSNAVRLVGGTAFLFYLEWKLALIVLIFMPVLGLSMRYFSKKVHTLSHHSMEQQAQVSKGFQESLSSVSLVKAFSSEARTLKRLISELRNVLHLSLEQTAVNSVANVIITALPGVVRVIILTAGAYWIVKDQWTLGSLLAFQAYLGYVFGPAQMLATANLQLQRALASLERVSSLFEIAPEDNADTGIKAEQLAGDINFKNVSFSYDAREMVLDDVSFHIKPGERVAIVGPSGVGKTTLLSLILLFYRPASGEIHFDGLPASSYNVSSLRKRIGYVSQKTRLLSGTLMKNLCYGNPYASIEQVIRATKAAGIHDFIIALPAGYDTEIGENGIDLSEGQKQRLSLARALIKDCDILVLDEPTASLDNPAETSILSSLPDLAQGKTLFIVASRAALMGNLDHILLLNDHRLVAVGTHAELMSMNGFYRSLMPYYESEVPRVY